MCCSCIKNVISFPGRLKYQKLGSLRDLQHHQHPQVSPGPFSYMLGWNVSCATHIIYIHTLYIYFSSISLILTLLVWLCSTGPLWKLYQVIIALVDDKAYLGYSLSLATLYTALDSTSCNHLFPTAYHSQTKSIFLTSHVFVTYYYRSFHFID